MLHLKTLHVHYMLYCHVRLSHTLIKLYSIVAHLASTNILHAVLSRTWNTLTRILHAPGADVHEHVTKVASVEVKFLHPQVKGVHARLANQVRVLNVHA